MDQIALSLLAADGTPSWVWAALLMAAFVGLTVLTMALARIAVQDHPPKDRPAGKGPGQPGPTP